MQQLRKIQDIKHCNFSACQENKSNRFFEVALITICTPAAYFEPSLLYEFGIFVLPNTTML